MLRGCAVAMRRFNLVASEPSRHGRHASQRMRPDHVAPLLQVLDNPFAKTNGQETQGFVVSSSCSRTSLVGL